ncbi:hypothetical protein Pcinc_038479 [Petrolisthes cinctipes]|uniref:NADH dehydrogenase [ubiquinone] 1 alpha subcomplex assembly factor 3 n=1 Tax=Petrolisthes cinctipes TaxID=88211 RepID=A0AAE1EKD7_PETCI|nr:hypothetical protein Pcinc_038479 [Petrolisthes cinctipes]
MLLRAISASRNILLPRFKCAFGQPVRWETTDRSVVKVLNLETDAGLMVDSFSQSGFRLNNGMMVIGPMAIFPKTVLSWRVNSSYDINEDSLSLFYLLEPKIDLLIIGIGDKGSTVDTKVIQFMKNKGINIELMPTESACTTFNFLNQEGRYVAGALIPPISLSIREDDVVQAERRRRKLFVSQDDDEVF